MKTTTLLAIGIVVAALPAQAQDYPSRPVTIVSAQASGGASDTIVRAMQEQLQAALGQPIVLENRPGASGNVATERVAKSVPDGYTLLAAASATIDTNPNIYAKLNFDPVKDFAPITQIVTTPNLLVVPNDLPVNSVAELVAYAKSQSGKLSFGSAGVGTSQHLAGELFRTMAGIDLQHVPYRGIAATVPDLLAGRLTMVFGNISAMQPLVREGKARALAVTSPRRWPSVPELPTMIELGFKDFDSSAWFGLMAPAGTPQPIIDRLHQETVRILARADIRERFDVLGMASIGNTPAEFAAVIAAETPQWAKVIKDAGIKASD